MTKRNDPKTRSGARERDSVTAQLVTGITRDEWLRRAELLRSGKPSKDDRRSTVAKWKELAKQSRVAFRGENEPDTVYRLEAGLTAGATLIEAQPRTSEEAERLARKGLAHARVEAERRKREERATAQNLRRASSRRARTADLLKDAIRRAYRDDPDSSQRDIAEATVRMGIVGTKFREFAPKKWRRANSLVEALNDRGLRNAVKKFISTARC